MYCEDVRRIAEWAKRWPTIPAVLTHTCESIARKAWFGSEDERFALPDEVIELGRSVLSATDVCCCLSPTNVGRSSLPVVSADTVAFRSFG